MKGSFLQNAWKGMAMGMAEVIPGVSGGTIALITGIYEKLIYTIRNIDPSLVKVWKNGGFSEVNRKLDFPFLISLLSGMLFGVLIGVFGITYLLENFPEPLWGFFFGLILASCLYVGKQVVEWNYYTIIGLVAGAFIAYFITEISPSTGSEHYGYIFISGAIAICALILPGVSGSFILLLMGMYTIIFNAVKHFLTERDLASLIVICVFALGCLTGMALFSRLMHYLFNHFKDISLAVLSGFMLGSLNKIWPWRNVDTILDKATLENIKVTSIENLNDKVEGFKVIREINTFPQDYWMGTPKVEWTIFALAAGFILVFLFDYFASKNNPD